MRPAAIGALIALASGWLSHLVARAARRPAAPEPESIEPPDPSDFDDPRALVERLADGMHGKIVCQRYLKTFAHLIVLRESKYMLSERDAMTRSMASLAGCDPEALRRDVQLVAECRDEDEERAELERMADLPPRPEPPTGQYI